MTRICVAITARASFARVKTVLEALLARGAQPDVLLAGSAGMDKFGSVLDDLRAMPLLGIHTLTALEPHGHDGMAVHAGLTLVEAARALARIAPDKVVVVADRYETLPISMAAAYQNIELVHLQGGERSGSIDDKVRDANTALADAHCVATRNAYASVGATRDHTRIYLTGCPSIDLALRARDRTPAFPAGHGIGPLLDACRPYLIVLYHPDTHLAPHLSLRETRMLLDEVHALSVRCDWQVAWIWPNIDAGTDLISKALREHHERFPYLFRFYRHIEAEAFLTLVAHARAVIGNSSLCVRECSALGTPAILVGKRQWGREVGPNIRSFDNLMDLPGPEPSQLYGDGTAGQQIAEILLS